MQCKEETTLQFVALLKAYGNEQQTVMSSRLAISREDASYVDVWDSCGRRAFVSSIEFTWSPESKCTMTSICLVVLGLRSVVDYSEGKPSAKTQRLCKMLLR
jgi:hypothetical protein